nr:toxin glutamine deamidase domain-containing protein [Umezawaea beigongshangensis]
MEIPDEVKWLLPIVVGESWPEGDEDKLRDLRDAWHRAADAVPGVSSTADGGARSILDGWTGDGAEAFEEVWKKYVEGDDAYFTSIVEACRALGDSCDATALDVEYTKYLIIASLIVLAISIAAMIASAAVTFGASTAGIVPAQIATRVAVQMIFRQLLQKLAQQGFTKVAQQVLQRVLREVATNVATGVALDAGIQGLQMASGDRRSWDLSKTGDAAVGGAVEGVVGAASNAVPRGATRGLSDSVGGEVLDGAVRGATRGAVEGAVTTVGEAAVTGNLDELSAKDVLMGTSSGAVDRGVGGTTDSLGTIRDLDVETPDTSRPGPSSSRGDSAAQPVADAGQQSASDSTDAPDVPRPGGAADPPGGEAATRASGVSPTLPADRADSATASGQTGSPVSASTPAQQGWTSPGGTAPAGGATPTGHGSPPPASGAAHSAPGPASPRGAGLPPLTSGPGQASPAPTGVASHTTGNTAAAPATASHPGSPTSTASGQASPSASGTGHTTPAPTSGSSPATATPTSGPGQSSSSGGYGRAPAPSGFGPTPPGGFGPQPGYSGHQQGPPPPGGVSATGTTGQPFAPRFDGPPAPPQQQSGPPRPVAGPQQGGTPPSPFFHGPQGAPPPRGPLPPPQRGPQNPPPGGRPTPPRPTPAPGGLPPRGPMPPAGPPPAHHPPAGRAPVPPQGYAPNGPRPQGPPPPGRPVPPRGFPPPNAPRPQGPPPPSSPGPVPPRPPASPARQFGVLDTPEPVAPPQARRTPEPAPAPEPPAAPEAPRSPEPTPVGRPTPTTEPDDAPPSGRDDLGEEHLFDPEHRATAADNAALAAGITGDARRTALRDAALARRDAAASLSGLSDEGAFALYAYTGHDVFDSANTAQRLGPEGGRAAFERARLQVRAMVSAVNELAPLEAELVRGIDVRGNRVLAELVADQYVPGRTTVEPTIVSASIRESPDFVSKFGEDVEIHVQAKTARDIHELSQTDGEREAVSKPGTQWYTHAKEVVEVERGGVVKQKTIVRVEEVLPGDPRYLDRAAAEREIADRRATNNANRDTFEDLLRKTTQERLGGGSSDAPEPAAPERSRVVALLGGYAGADALLDGDPIDSGTTGGHDWSPLSRATNPPAEPAIHADTANAHQSAGYVAERHPHVAGVNPRFHDVDAYERGYQTNCTRGVVASALRRAGIDTEAGPLHPEDVESAGTLDHVRDHLGGDWQSHADYDSVIRAMRDLPVDSRAVIAVKHLGPDGVEYGHVAEVVHTREGVAFVDPQTNSLMRLPHPPAKLDLLPYDLADVAERHSTRPDTERSTVDRTTTSDSGYGAADTPPRGDDLPPPTREEINRYLQEPRVQNALRVADATSHRLPDARITVDGQQLHIGEAIAALLPRHPELAALLRDVPFLENSLLARPETLANLLRHPQAIAVLEECVHEVQHHEDGPEALAEQYEAEPDPAPALLTPEQAALSALASDIARDNPASHRQQPGFDESKKDDDAYREQYLDGLYHNWSLKQGQLHALADAVARATGGDASSRKTEKSRARARDKINEYENKAYKLTDLVGSKIQYRTVADAYKGLGVLLSKLQEDDARTSIVKFKDRFLGPQGSGYRDLQLNVRLELDDGTFHVAELRLHLTAIDEVANFEHVLYEVRRDFDALAEKEGRTMTAEERALSSSISERQKALFDTAFKKGRGTTRSGGR